MTSYEGTNPISRGSVLMPSSAPKLPLPSMTYLKVRIQHGTLEDRGHKAGTHSSSDHLGSLRKCVVPDSGSIAMRDGVGIKPWT